MAEFYHRPVMLGEVINGLCVKDGGVYFDGTLGGGGHSYAILAASPAATLIGTDRDGEAIKASKERLAPFEGRFRLYHSNYKDFENVLGRAGVDRLDGVLLDLGISSHQIDEEERGFSYRSATAPLDMRMDKSSAFTAKEVVNGYPPEKLLRVLREYGEEPFAAAIVRNIVKRREQEEIATCGKLREIVEESIPPRFRSAACARQTFQAIRIEVNGELEGLGECLRGLIRKLKPGGRVCVLTFHSLEDRIVKQVYRDLASDCVCPKNFPVCVCGKKKEIEIINARPITAGEEEIKQNPRSKSAKLRIAEKTGA